jgi:hypothetical protein
MVMEVLMNDDQIGQRTQNRETYKELAGKVSHFMEKKFKNELIINEKKEKEIIEQ